MSDCLFCKIVNRQIPAKIVYEDERVVVIEDINPQAPLHALVIPKAHIASLNDVTPAHDALIGEMNRRATAIARDRGYADRGLHRAQYQSGSGANGLSHSPSPARGPPHGVAAGIIVGR